MESRQHSAELTWDYLSEREQECLGNLCHHYRQGQKYDWHPEAARTMDCGGSNGSHHSYTLGKLVAKGLAEHKKAGCDWGESPKRYRGSKLYRPSARGLEVEASRRKEM